MFGKWKEKYEDLKSEHEALKLEHEALKVAFAELISKFEELQTQFKKTSKNSSHSPSSDGMKKGTVKNSREKSGKPNGGQPGHEGRTKELTPTPDKVIKIVPKEKCECGGAILLATDAYTVRQVTDVEPVKIVTVEYRAHEGQCETCGKTHKSNFPKGVEGTSSYGERLKAWVCYLTTYQLIPLKRATELIRDILGIHISQGFIVKSEREAYEALAEVEARIKQEIIDSNVAGFDETGLRVMGMNHWLHIASTPTCTVYGAHRKRGKEAMNDMGILPFFKGTAVHDHWKSYFHYLCAHAECNAHHLRDLLFIHEELGMEWAGKMASLLLRIKLHVDLSKTFGVDSLPQEDIELYEAQYQEILAGADQKNAPLKSSRMVKRMTAYEQETLLFMYDFEVPFTNNLAERDVRMPKAKQKISGGFRSKEGADSFARTRGYLSTIRKRGKKAIDGLVAAFNGEATDFLYPNSNTCNA